MCRNNFQNHPHLVFQHKEQAGRAGTHRQPSVPSSNPRHGAREGPEVVGGPSQREQPPNWGKDANWHKKKLSLKFEPLESPSLGLCFLAQDRQLPLISNHCRGIRKPRGFPLLMILPLKFSHSLRKTLTIQLSNMPRLVQMFFLLCTDLGDHEMTNLQHSQHGHTGALAASTHFNLDNGEGKKKQGSSNLKPTRFNKIFKIALPVRAAASTKRLQTLPLFCNMVTYSWRPQDAISIRNVPFQMHLAVCSSWEVLLKAGTFRKLRGAERRWLFLKPGSKHNFSGCCKHSRLKINK